MVAARGSGEVRLCEVAAMVWDSTNTVTFTKQSNNKRLLYISSVVVAFALVLSLTWLLPRLTEVHGSDVSTQNLFVIDTDPGIDDALAILTILGESSANVLAITCVRGNANISNVAINALKILTIARKQQIPVYAGTDFGIAATSAINDWYGKDGLGDLPFPDPPSPSSVQDEHAAAFLARIVKENPGRVTVVAIGPLTNIALALHLNTQFLQQARKVVVLGGSINGYGNVNPGVEFNFYTDPEAASFVLRRASETEALVTIVPFETCNDNDLNKDWRWKELANIDNSVVSFLNKLEEENLKMHPSPKYIPFDTYAAAVSLYLNAVTHSKELYGAVETEGKHLRGALVTDHFNITENKANLEVIVEVNTTVIKQTLIENLSSFK